MTSTAVAHCKGKNCSSISIFNDKYSSSALQCILEEQQKWLLQLFYYFHQQIRSPAPSNKYLISEHFFKYFHQLYLVFLPAVISTNKCSRITTNLHFVMFTKNLIFPYLIFVDFVYIDNNFHPKIMKNT